MPEKFLVGGGGLSDFKVYLSPLLGEGVRSRIERCRERVPRDVERGFRESEREGRVREGEGRYERGEERDCDNFAKSVMSTVLSAITWGHFNILCQ